MPDLDPLINTPLTPITPPIVQDPGVTRVLQRQDDPAEVFALADVARASCSFVITDGHSDVQIYEANSRLLSEAQMRREFLVVVDEDRSAAITALRSGLYGTGVTWQVCDRVLGGRASVLAEAVEYAANEFLVMGFGADSPLERIPRLLGHMWLEGADVGVIDPSYQPEDDFGRPRTVDAASRLCGWLGLSGPTPQGGMVIMRRWVARWLFNEISRSIDPADELADRARLLGLAIVHLT